MCHSLNTSTRISGSHVGYVLLLLRLPVHIFHHNMYKQLKQALKNVTFKKQIYSYTHWCNQIIYSPLVFIINCGYFCALTAFCEWISVQMLLHLPANRADDFTSTLTGPLYSTLSETLYLSRWLVWNRATIKQIIISYFY